MFWKILIVILVILVAALAALYFWGNKMQQKQREHVIKIRIILINNLSELLSQSLFSCSAYRCVLFCQSGRAKPVTNRFYHFTTDTENFHSIISRKERGIFLNTSHAFSEPAFTYIERLIAFQFYFCKFFLFIYHQSIPFL